MDTSEPRKSFPAWSQDHQDIWIDFFMDFAGRLIDGQLSEGSPIKTEFEADIRLASELADTALRELQYRFAIQEMRPRKTRKPVKKTSRASK